MLLYLLVPILICFILLLLWLIFREFTDTPFGRVSFTVAFIFKFLDLASPKKPTVKKLRRGSDFNAKISQGKRMPMHKLHEIIISSGNTNIHANLYIPVNETNLPVIVFYHGGGWVVGGPHTHDALCRYLAFKSRYAVLSVDYRLAPEHKFPVAVEDSYRALEWVSSNGHIYNLDGSKICVCGDSAGGNLAAVVCLKAKEKKHPPVTCQVLLYPAVDLSQMDTESYRYFAKGYGLSKTEMEFFRDHYLNQAEESCHPDVSPILACGHAGLPPAMIITAGFDVLRDEAESYALKLKEAGVEVKLSRYDKMFHGFMCTGGLIRDAYVAADEVAEFIVNTCKKNSDEH